MDNRHAPASPDCRQVPLILWPSIYARYKLALKQAVIVVTGKVSRREGTFNIVVERAQSLGRVPAAPQSKD